MVSSTDLSICNGDISSFTAPHKDFSTIKSLVFQKIMKTELDNASLTLRSIYHHVGGSAQTFEMSKSAN